MIRSIGSIVLAVFSSLVVRVHCLSAIPGSPCYDTCNGDQSTSSGDIVCIDSDFKNTAKGRALSTCLSCLRSSTYQNGFMGDSTLFLYYMSSVQQTCLSGMPAAPISNCSNSCGDLTSAFSGIGGRGFFQSPYAYCSASDSVYEDNASACAKCLRSQDGTVILGNFVYEGNVACLVQPNLQNGGSIPGADQLFNATELNGSISGGTNGTSTVSPSSTGTVTTSTKSTDPASRTQTAKASATSASSTTKDESVGSGGGLSRGAAAGIGIVLGTLGIAIIVFLAVLARRRMLWKQAARDGTGTGAAAGAGAWSKMRESPETRQPEMRQTAQVTRGATPPAAGVFVPPVAVAPKKSKSFKSIKSLRSLGLTPRSSAWYNAANPKSSSDVTALPQRGWD